MLKIPYLSTKFQPHLGSKFQGSNVCNASWADIVWAAITVGKAERSHLLRFGKYSLFELVYRTSILFANLREDNSYIKASSAYKALDPSEKGAISYFLGITAAKLLAEKYLGVPWLMHLDVYRSQLSPILSAKKIKPDLVGLNLTRNWVVIEAKGRSGNLINNVIPKAKKQTRKLRRISGAYPSYRIALACYFQSKTFKIAWEDPDGYDKEAKDISLSVNDLLANYYDPFVHLFNEKQGQTESFTLGRQVFSTFRVDDSDLVLGIDINILNKKPSEEIIELLTDQAHHPIGRLEDNTKIGADGILVKLGDTWKKENMQQEPQSRQISI